MIYVYIYIYICVCIYMYACRTLIIAAFTAFTTLFLLAQTYVGNLSNHYILCSLYLACTGAAGAASYLCALDSQAQNFKEYRGMSMGFTSASLGISGLVFSQLNDRFFKSNHKEDNTTFNFLIFVGSCTFIVNIFGSFILDSLKQEEKRRVEQQQPQEDNDLTYYTQSIRSFSTSSTRFVEDDMNEERPLLSKNVILSVDTISSIDIKNIRYQHEEETEISGIAFFMDPVGFSLASALLVILGLGYVYFANLGQLLTSVSPKDISFSEAQHLRNTHVSIFSIANCLSRALFGALSDLFKKKVGIHRIWFFWTASIGLMISMIFLISSVSNSNELILCTVMTAIVYGITFGVAPATITEFGTKTFARNWGWLLCAPAIGSQLFSVLFGTVYEKESKRQGELESCYGSACYKSTFMIGILSALVCNMIMAVAIYKKGLYKRGSTL
ncbi:major facilitator superfamily domain-containing protein [Cokeromyces recurvatus]|uniref:major facilitator superfamily domain-containing protein n=1 Tax=Cokeromyces recurvatus TaxID=90255 RepID=UPI002220FCF9|nr:major facilitator superfamily domain-containing protein [Cokeromyces recurvatus]KAI7903967.1 major facilitator superfamily domain-containing protein [Cokeromyces recurvatus]